jgi:hypothetical protein
MTRWCRTLSTAAIVTTLACSRPSRPLDQPLTMEPLELAASAGSAMPQLSVSGDRAIVSWVETTAAQNAGTRATLKFAERTPAGWSAPQVVASGSDWFISAADVPSVVRVDERTLAAHWLRTTNERREAYDLLLAWSTDGGRTWTAPATPHHDGTTTQHGFASLFPMGGQRLGVVWLDGRATDDPSNDNMSVRSAIFDRPDHQVSESLVDDRVCDCCPTAVAIADGTPVAVFRDRSQTEIRDIAAARLVNGAWTAPSLVHADNWHIEACPVNGPAVSALGRDVAVAWMTAEGEQGHSFAAFSVNGGAAFGPPVRLDDEGSLGRVGIALSGTGSAFATWIEFSNGKAQLRVRAVDRSGRRGPAQTVSGIESDRASGYPRIARSGSELLFAWTETAGGQPRVRTGAARLF